MFQQPWDFLLKIIILGCFGGTTIFGNHDFRKLSLFGNIFFYPARETKAGASSSRRCCRVVRRRFPTRAKLPGFVGGGWRSSPGGAYLEDQPPFISHLANLEGEEPYLADLLTMVINHLLTGMILQVPVTLDLVN